jgi:hypothetical protein
MNETIVMLSELANSYSKNNRVALKTTDVAPLYQALKTSVNKNQGKNQLATVVFLRIAGD